MKRFAIAVGVMLSAVVPATALAAAPTKVHAVTYERAYRQVVHQFGKQEPGRNIIKRGLSNGRAATDADVVKSIGVLMRMLTPTPPPAPTSAPATYTPRTTPAATATAYTAPTYSSSPASYGGGYSIPAGIVQCESGGNWRAVNSSSGAGGAYQIMPSTWSAYGGQGLPQNASPAEQSRIAAAIWAKQGSSAWVC